MLLHQCFHLSIVVHRLQPDDPEIGEDSHGPRFEQDLEWVLAGNYWKDNNGLELDQSEGSLRLGY